MKMTTELSPSSFHKIVRSFPNLKHLDIRTSQRMNKYSQDLVLLTKLEHLRLQQYRTRRLGPPSWPARLIFPPTEYTSELDLLLPFLPHLACIEICISADIYPASAPSCWDSDSESDWEWDSELDFQLVRSPPGIKVDYSFSVMRRSSGAYVVLQNAQVTDSYSKQTEHV
ncbi:hypothetical protein B0H16DRAFT_1573065 [Mycena metata]|uniref:F-box domain-containing protein n=1 Tax=Mycena metata TaxID=1033252 RepID=A0AAD7I7P8_9AGAR|nr:hypothetical protein B0H16DRAFT_1573065 [Mycena metata]